MLRLRVCGHALHLSLTLQSFCWAFRHRLGLVILSYLYETVKKHNQTRQSIAIHMNNPDADNVKCLNQNSCQAKWNYSIGSCFFLPIFSMSITLVEENRAKEIKNNRKRIKSIRIHRRTVSSSTFDRIHPTLSFPFDSLSTNTNEQSEIRTKFCLTQANKIFVLQTLIVQWFCVDLVEYISISISC